MSSAFPMTVIPRKRRGIELVLVIFALAITLGAYALVDLNVNNRLPPMFPIAQRKSIRCDRIQVL